GIGLDRNVEGGRTIIDGAADERLHRRVAAAGIDELHIEPVVLEMAGRARDLVGHAAQELTAIGEVDLLALSCARRSPQRRNRAGGERGALEQRAPRHAAVGYAGGGFIAAAHRGLPKPAPDSSLPESSGTLRPLWRRARACGRAPV